MTIRYFPNLVQGSDEWFEARCGLLTASETKLILTPTLKTASNEKERAHLYELLAQRITRYVEPHYMSDDMLRGHDDEIEGKALYSRHFAPVLDMGFITNDEWGFTFGYSPDGLVGDDGLIECKSRRQKYQIETVVECVKSASVPMDYLLQIQTALLVTQRKWCDFISYSGGLPMVRIRAYPDPKIAEAIIAAAWNFEVRLAEKLLIYRDTIDENPGFIPTQRHVDEEMVI